MVEQSQTIFAPALEAGFGRVKPLMERLFIALPFCALLFFIEFPFSPELSLIILLGTFVKFEKVSSFLWLNAVFLVISGGLFAVTVNLGDPYPAAWEWIRQANDRTLLMPNWIAFGMAVVAYFCAFYIIYRVIALTKGKYALGIVSASLVIFVFAYDGARNVPVANLALFAIIMATAKAFWFLCCNFSDYPLLKGTSVFAQFLASVQPWQQGLAKACVLGGYEEIVSRMDLSEEEQSKNRLSALYLLLWGSVLTKCAFAIQRYTISKNGIFITHADEFSFLKVPLSLPNYVEGNLGIAASWLFIGLTCFIFLVKMAGYSHAAVAVARLLGLRMEKNMDEPYRSRTFTDFLKRIYYYYISFLTRLIFYPLWARLGMIKSKTARIFIVTFVTIGGGGLITTALGSVYGLMRMNAVELIGTICGNYPYFLLLGLFAGLSSLFRAPGKNQASLPSLLARSFVYFWMYTICFSTELGRHDYGPQIRINALLHLFGLH